MRLDGHRACAKELYGDVAEVGRMPMDFSWGVERFLKRVRPDVVGLVGGGLAQSHARVSSAGHPGVHYQRQAERAIVRGYHRAKRVVGSLFESLLWGAGRDVRGAFPQDGRGRSWSRVR